MYRKDTEHYTPINEVAGCLCIKLSILALSFFRRCGFWSSGGILWRSCFGARTQTHYRGEGWGLKNTKNGVTYFLNNPLTYQTINTHLLVGKEAKNFKGKKLFIIEKDFLFGQHFVQRLQAPLTIPNGQKVASLELPSFSGAGTQTRTFLKYETFVL